jgi:hypothetical protein
MRYSAQAIVRTSAPSYNNYRLSTVLAMKAMEKSSKQFSLWDMVKTALKCEICSILHIAFY